MRKRWKDDGLPVEHQIAEANLVVEAAERLQQDEDWSRIVEGCEDEIERRRDQLEQGSKIGETDDYQRGMIAGLRLVVAMPVQSAKDARSFITNA